MKRFRNFYTGYSDRLFGYILRKSGNPHLAADIVQESFTRYYERYRNKGNNPALLFTIGRNLFIDHVKQTKNERRLRDDSVQGFYVDQASSYELRENSQRILAAISQLREDERDILTMVITSRLKYHEIAKITGCSVANIKVKVHRARKKLQQLLQVNENE